MIGYLLGALAMTHSPWLLPSNSLPLLVLLMAGVVLRGPRGPLLLGVLCAAVMLSWCGHNLLKARLPETCNRQAFNVSGEVVSLPRVTSMAEGLIRQRFEFALHSVESRECSGPRKVLLTYYGDEKIVPGQWWEFEVSLRRPWGLSNPGSHNMQSWYSLSGIDGVGTAKSARSRKAGEGESWTRLHHRLRQRLAANIDAVGLSGPAESVLKAVTVADKSGLDYDMWSLLQGYGVNHLLVISGLHIALVAALAHAAGRVFASMLAIVAPSISRWRWAECSALCVAAMYVFLAGFSVATQRALLMLACFLLANMLQRQSAGFNSLLLAAFLIVVVNPLVMLGSGFWLSFTAVFALLWLAQWSTAGARARFVAPHFFMALVMFPLGALWFGGASWVSAPANFLLIPVVGFFIVPLSLMGSMLSLLGLEGASTTVWTWAALPIDLLWPLASGIDDNAAFFATLSASSLSVALSLLAAALIIVPLRRSVRLVCGVMLLPLFLSGPLPASSPQINFLDVGQGTAVVFSVGERVLLYDTGGGNPAGPSLSQSVVLPWLRASGFDTIDDLVISHDDWDHSAGAADVMAALPVGQVWQGEQAVRGGRSCSPGLSWQWRDKARFHILSLAAEQEGNAASCVLLIEAAGYRFLLAGDIGVKEELELIRYWGESLDSDVLLVAHHGSKTSSSQAWLNAVSPSVAIVTAGYASRFGHPHDEVMKRLQRSGAVVHETARDGAITMAPGITGGLLISGHRWGYKPWWM
ncbi:MAG: DNA internalization-related competence protein ComEC/Rec2 [Halioglobus sp.]